MDGRKRLATALAAGAGMAALAGAAAMAQETGPAPSLADLGALSIEELANLPVTMVARRAEPVSQAPAAIFVITHEDIERSGATSIPEMLRLAPNLGVAQASSSRYVITARGLSGNDSAQNFTNKLLVMIDGRVVYTPLYSGVYWDMQDVLPQDVDRIEVISGPGATLWGSNAINGVINIITRKASETQGGFVEAGGGSQQQALSARYGGKVGDTLAWRVYAKTQWDRQTVTPAGQGARDGWTKPQAGVRMDWTPNASDILTLQGDAYNGAEHQAAAGDEIISGSNVMARWTHGFKTMGQLQVQAYWDRAGRETQQGGGRFTVDTFDLDVQHSLNIGSRNEVVWGAGARTIPYRIDGTASIFFRPASRTLNQANVFAQDTLRLTDATRLTLGLKLEDDPYSGLAVLPSARLAHSFGAKAMVWTAASRAIRAPTPFDRDVVEAVGGTTLLSGNPDFQPETVNAYEIGTKLEPMARLSMSVQGFYNDYDSLKTIEPTPGTVFPLTWGNGLRGYTWGIEGWGGYQATDWWRLSAGFDLFRGRLTFKPGASGFFGASQAGNEPRHQVLLKSSMAIGKRITWEVDGRWVDARRNPSLVPYAEVNTSVAFEVSNHLRLQVTGANLVHATHQEFPGVQAIPRSVYAALRWSF